MIIIYTLSHPLTKEIRYVGKTSKTLKRRLMNHICDAKVKRYKNHNCNWIQSLLKDNLEPIIEELDSTSEKDWEYLETYWINQFRQWGFNLTNLTNGGDGNKGQIFSKESIEKRAIKLRGQKRSDEFKKRHSELLKGKPKSELAKANIRKVVINNQGRKVVQLSLDSNEYIREWDCMAEPADFYNVDRTSLMRCCTGKFKKSAGFKWMFLEDFNKFKDMTQSNGNVVGTDDIDNILKKSV